MNIGAALRKQRTFTKHVEPGQKIPAGYGVSWHDLSRRIGVCHPMPLNWFIGLAHRAYVYMLCPWTETAWEKRFADLQQRELAEKITPDF